LPHDIASLAQNRLEELTNKMEQSLPPKLRNLTSHEHVNVADYIPSIKDYDYASMLGQKGQPSLMEKLIQGTVHHLPELAGGGALLRGGWRRLIGTHELDAVRDAVRQFGGNNFSYTPNVANEARRYLPNTEATRELFRNSGQGEYPASYAMRSQLGRHQSNLANSPLAAERLLAPKVADLRQTMLTQLQDALREQGLHTEAEMLPSGISKYARYKQVKNAVEPTLSRYAKRLIYRVPETVLLGLLGVEGYNYFKKLKNG
jgi:hypothetical protein